METYTTGSPFQSSVSLIDLDRMEDGVAREEVARVMPDMETLATTTSKTTAPTASLASAS